MRNFLQHSATVLFALLTVFQAAAQKTKSAQIEAYLNKAHQDGLFNGNVLVADHHKMVLKKAIGNADASKQQQLTTAYRFHIGSIAKEFDAVGLMMLQEQGKLNLNDKISKFFPSLPQWAQKISVKNLLQYTSGLPDIKWSTVHSDADNWKGLQALQQLDFEPGSTYAYNNNNTFMRRRIIEKVSGLNFDDFVMQKILKKAGIKNGIVDPSDKAPLMARSFNKSFKQDGLEVPISGWTCLNLDDFYSWMQAINNFTLINPASTREIITPFGEDKQAGLGSGTMKGNRVITHIHDGTGMNYQALAITDTEKGRTIILLTNQKQGNLYDIAEAISAILDHKPYQALQASNE
ncbi:serine hydrolase domain-containing protein [Pedobacter sp. KR3-3]|uniref:Serine hydrolase domain-containing protein n=1 Tax=Pedobacter albus TaxID=3113905 RepID=A0ABU7ID16_9SPHI|nr:serine hydrolase domain-containing protein [Pedobacter sp. KR3-3]MEE1947171.1 serine hydrolase domain-containing protein [Pedobacter sp. KR3-3]